jgi:hypothetical protein
VALPRRHSKIAAPDAPTATAAGGAPWLISK